MDIKLWENTPYFNPDYDQPEPYLTFYPAKSGAESSAVIICPGGAYIRRAQHEGEPVALWLNSIGISAFVLAYRVSPYTARAISGDVLRAVRVVRYNADKLNIRPEKIGVLGFSAGGHLASTAAVHFDDFLQLDPLDPVDNVSSRPDAAILCYPVITSSPEITRGSSFDRLAGNEPDAEALTAFLSNETQIKANTPPVFLWHTSDDSAVDVENSLRFATALRRKTIPFALHIYPHGKHGLGLAADDPVIGSWTRECALWLRTLDFN